ncbi:MAG: hypothetical protein AAF485_09530 [Chloroflexota bacterium]
MFNPFIAEQIGTQQREEQRQAAAQWRLIRDIRSNNDRDKDEAPVNNSLKSMFTFRLKGKRKTVTQSV